LITSAPVNHASQTTSTDFRNKIDPLQTFSGRLFDHPLTDQSRWQFQPQRELTALSSA